MRFDFVRRLALGLLASVGALAILVSGWLAWGHSILLDRYLAMNEAPRPARAIVCISGGSGGHQLPTAEGFQRIYTAVQLHADGFAPVIVFSGGGPQTLSEAEVYAEVAGWLGLRKDAVVLDPFSGGTADHPRNILRIPSFPLTTDTPILVVTSPLHARRTALCFSKVGFTDFRMVTSWVAAKAGPEIVRDRRTSAVPEFRRNNKDYGDPLNRLKWGMDSLLTALHELAAIAVYKFRGQI